MPVAVSGLVEATNSATIYAETAGVVASLPFREGDSVTVSDILSKQSSPVVDANIRLANAQADLVRSERLTTIEANQSSLETALVSGTSADQLAVLRDTGNQARIDEAAKALSIGVSGNLNTILSAVDYINNHRSLFTAQGLDDYDEVLKLIYGQTPTYFTSILAPSPERSFVSLKSLSEQASSTVADARAAGDRTVQILLLLDQALASAEDDVFNKRNSPTETLKKSYLSQKSNISVALQSMEELLASTNQTIDAALEDAVIQAKSVSLADLDQQSAETQLEYSLEIANNSAMVQDASVGLANAEKSLGIARAPFSGLVTEVFLDEGEYASPGTPLLRLIGDGMTEIKVTVPQLLGDSLATGQSFVVGGEVVGFVERFVVEENGRGFTVIITLQDDQFLVGETVRGFVVVDQSETVFSVPREYVHFDSDGALVRYQTGDHSRVRIVYDNGRSLFLVVEEPKAAPLITNWSELF